MSLLSRLAPLCHGAPRAVGDETPARPGPSARRPGPSTLLARILARPRAASLFGDAR